jgi:predicted ester cyclase
MANPDAELAVRRYFEVDHNGRDNTEQWDEVCDSGLTLYASLLPGPLVGLEAARQFTSAVHAAMTGFTLQIEDIVSDRDLVAVRWTMSGKHTAPLPLPTGLLPPTGNTVTVTGTSFCRLRNGKIIEERVEADWLGALRQLGVME